MFILQTVAQKSVKVMLFKKSFRMSATGKKNYTFAQVLNIITSESSKVYDTI